MAIPLKYRKSGETSVISYNYTDISTGTGVVKFYGFSSKELTTDSLRLSTEALNTNLLTETATQTSSDFTLSGTYNFDLTVFQLPQRIKGTALCVIPWAISAVATGTASGYIIVSLVRVSGGVETVIGTATTETLAGSDSAIEYQLTTIAVALTQTHLKKGDTLRLKLESMLKKTAATTAIMYIVHDPTEVEEGIITKANFKGLQLIAYVPFRVDL